MEEKIKIAIVSLNNPSLEGAKKIFDVLNIEHNCEIYNKNISEKNFIKFNNLDDILDLLWNEYDVIVAVMATGAVIRKFAPYLESKDKDPAVLVSNIDATKIIPLLSGHLGGANYIASILEKNIDSCISFTTTVSDQTNSFTIDLFAQKFGFKINNIKEIAKLQNKIINREKIVIKTYDSIKKILLNEKNFKEECIEVRTVFSNTQLPQFYITPFNIKDTLNLQVFDIVLGIGMNRGTSCLEIKEAIDLFCFEHNLQKEQIAKLATFTKKDDENGLLEYIKKENLECEFFDEEMINSLTQDFSPSMAEKFFNIKGVAEPSAILSSKYKELFLKKHVYKNITIAGAF